MLGTSQLKALKGYDLFQKRQLFMRRGDGQIRTVLQWSGLPGQRKKVPVLGPLYCLDEN